MRNILKNASHNHLSRTTLTLSISLLLIISSLTPAQNGTSSRPRRITFIPGSVSTQVRGYIPRGQKETFFVLKAKAGDHMIVNIISTTRGFETGGEVMAPSGAVEGRHGGIIFRGHLKETGDFKIRVAANLMAGDRTDGSFILEIVITTSFLKDG
jgi:hypothetical protein